MTSRSADAGTRPEDVLVAVPGDRIAGDVKLRRAALPARGHVQEIHGLAVDPDRQGHGLGRLLLEAASVQSLQVMCHPGAMSPRSRAPRPRTARSQRGRAG